MTHTDQKTMNKILRYALLTVAALFFAASTAQANTYSTDVYGAVTLMIPPAADVDCEQETYSTTVYDYYPDVLDGFVHARWDYLPPGEYKADVTLPGAPLCTNALWCWMTPVSGGAEIKHTIAIATNGVRTFTADSTYNTLGLVLPDYYEGYYVEITLTKASPPVVLLANQFIQGDNTLDTLFTNWLDVGSTIWMNWNGSGYDQFDWTSSGWSPSYAGTNVLNPGTAFWIQGADYSEGQLFQFGGIIDPTTITNTLSASQQMTSTHFPVRGDAGLGDELPNGSQIQKYNAVDGWIVTTKAPWSGNWTAEPSFVPGEGFFVDPAGTNSIPWPQSLP